jgi:hypothetical protein
MATVRHAVPASAGKGMASKATAPSSMSCSELFVLMIVQLFHHHVSSDGV